MSMKVTAAPSVEPCTAAEVKLIARMTATGLDSLIASDYIPAARRACEQRTQRYPPIDAVPLLDRDLAWQGAVCYTRPVSRG